MKKLSKNIYWISLLTFFLIIGHLLGCSKWVLIKRSEERYHEEDIKGWIEIELYTKEKVILKNTYIIGNHLYGTKVILKPVASEKIEDEYIWPSGESPPLVWKKIEERYGIHLKEIKQIRGKRTNIEAIIGLSILGLIIGGIIALIIYNSIEGPDFSVQVSY